MLVIVLYQFRYLGLCKNLGILVQILPYICVCVNASNSCKNLGILVRFQLGKIKSPNSTIYYIYINEYEYEDSERLDKGCPRQSPYVVRCLCCFNCFGNYGLVFIFKI